MSKRSHRQSQYRQPARGSKGRKTNGGSTRFIPRAQQGYTRTVGNYGRYAPSGGELKFHDVTVDDAAIAQNGTILNTGSINLIPQGITEITRVGRKCTIKSINWHYSLTSAETDGGASATNPDVVRIILYLDKQCNGATATITQLLRTDFFNSFRNLTESGRFRILMDKFHTLNCMAGGGNGTASDWAARITQGSFYKKCNIPLEFNNTTGAITELRSNNLGVLILSKAGSGAIFASSVRLRFSDGS